MVPLISKITLFDNCLLYDLLKITYTRICGGNYHRIFQPIFKQKRDIFS